MHTYEDLRLDLINMGLVGDEIILIHSSMKAIGKVKNNADTVLKVWMDYFKQGALLLPTHTWATINETHNTYDPEKEPACVGVLPNLFLKKDNVVRSLHPTHSVGAYGQKAVNYIRGEENLTTPTPKEGVYGRLKEEKGIILLIGCNLGRNTTIHAIEERMNISDRLTAEPIKMYIKTKAETLTRYFYKHFNAEFPHLSENYTRIHDVLVEQGIMTTHRFGSAVVYKMEADKLSTFIESLLNEDPKLFDTLEPYKVK